MELTKVKTKFQDDRGAITDVLVKEAIEYVTVISSKAGSLRGNHYHKETFQWVYVLSGKIHVCAQEEGCVVEELIISTGDLILNEPLERHAFKVLEESIILVLTRGPRGGENYEDDTYRMATPLIPENL